MQELEQQEEVEVEEVAVVEVVEDTFAAGDKHAVVAWLEVLLASEVEASVWAVAGSSSLLLWPRRSSLSPPATLAAASAQLWQQGRSKMEEIKRITVIIAPLY